MTPLVGFEFVASHPIPSSPTAQTQVAQCDHEEIMFRCVRCNYGGCDVRVSGCECSYHARCIPIDSNEQISVCPHCTRPTSGLILNPMTFTEVDEARKAASISKLTSKRGRKRRNSTISENESNDENGSTSSDAPTIRNEKDMGMANCRTGRWTPEEIKFCDTLISSFKQGQLPLAEGIKLNDFLTSMLKSKQSRLTKKMKNAKLSSITFRPLTRYIKNDAECREFSKLEHNFFLSIQDRGHRAELKFHMRREWRDMFCSFCVNVGQRLDADAWLTSVDEVERRSSIARDASRMQRRKVMMVNALNHDSSNAEAGVFIEKNGAELATIRGHDMLLNSSCQTHMNSSETDELLSLLIDDIPSINNNGPGGTNNDMSLEMNGKSSVLHSSPFLHKISAYIKRRNIPFEQADVWVPSLTAGDSQNAEPKCRLNFAGSTTMDAIIPSCGSGPAEAMSTEMKFNLLSFGDYSQKFSFDVGCGLPGRVYGTGASTWEQNVQIAPSAHFERCGAADQWGIKTVVGIPIASPNVGRIIIVLYSIHNRKKCEALVEKLKNEFTKLLPTPKWKLIVDVSVTPEEDSRNRSTEILQKISSHPASDAAPAHPSDTIIDKIIRLLGDEMPSSLSSNIPTQVQNLMSLRLLLLRPRRSVQEEEIVNTISGSYSSYSKSRRTESDIAIMLAHDFMFLTQAQQPMTINSQQLPFLPHNSGVHAAAQFTQAPHVPQQSLVPPQHHQSHVSPTMPDLSIYGGSMKHSMNETTLDPKHFYSGLDDARLDNNFRPDSPTLAPIIAPVDSLSVVST